MAQLVDFDRTGLLTDFLLRQYRSDLSLAKSRRGVCGAIVRWIARRSERRVGDGDRCLRFSALLLPTERGRFCRDLNVESKKGRRSDVVYGQGKRTLGVAEPTSSLSPLEAATRRWALSAIVRVPRDSARKARLLTRRKPLCRVSVSIAGRAPLLSMLKCRGPFAGAPRGKNEDKGYGLV